MTQESLDSMIEREIKNMRDITVGKRGKITMKQGPFVGYELSGTHHGELCGQYIRIQADGRELCLASPLHFPQRRACTVEIYNGFVRSVISEPLSKMAQSNAELVEMTV